MMHARGFKKFKKPVASFRGGEPIEWNTPERNVDDPAGEAQEGAPDALGYNIESGDPGVMMKPPDVDGESDTSRFLEYHAGNYGDMDPAEFLDGFDGGHDGSCDEGGMHLACCAAHLAKAKEAHTVYDSEACHKSLNASMYHLQAFHKALKDALNQ